MMGRCTILYLYNYDGERVTHIISQGGVGLSCIILCCQLCQEGGYAYASNIKEEDDDDVL